MAAPTAGRRILVVDDEVDIARLVELHLADAGHRVTLAHDGKTGLDLATSGGFDLVVLDLKLPVVDGLEICRRIRAGTRYVPILMVTARSAELDRILGLEMGADDYLTKPFNVRELVARVKAIFRRGDALAAPAAAVPERMTRGGLTLDLARRAAEVDGRALTLTAKEFDLLAHFARHPGRVFTRAELLDTVWGYSHEGYEHTVNSHINRLRAKLEPDPTAPRYILTVWGVGYRFAERPEPPPP